MFVLRPHTTGLALAATVVILWAVCSLFYAIAPGALISTYATLFHGFQMTNPPPPMTFVGFLYGSVYLAIGGYVGGWLFGSLYRAFHRASSREEG